MIIFLHCAVRTKVLFSPLSLFLQCVVDAHYFCWKSKQSRIPFFSPPRPTLPPHEADYLKVTKNNKNLSHRFNTIYISALSTGRHLIKAIFGRIFLIFLFILISHIFILFLFFFCEVVMDSLCSLNLYIKSFDQTCALSRCSTLYNIIYIYILS